LTRLGVFGGAFDPPHKAHVALARAAIDQLQLDELRVFPTGQAWHRSHALTDAQHRLALARIAFGDLPNTVIDDRELRRQGPTYTIDTLRELQAEQRGAQLFLVMGEDQALSLTKWREWEAIVQLAIICVAERPDAQVHATLAPTGLPAEAEVRLLRLPSMAESATEVRDLIAHQEDITRLVPPGVARYIASHHLYQSH
jgi:nicotinate-nucleotide adenylyltransferase